MHKLILKNYENTLLEELAKKGRKKPDDADTLEFIMGNLDALVVVTHGDGESDTMMDAEPQWGVNTTETKKETYYLPLRVKRMVFNLLYPDGIIGEPEIEVSSSTVRISASVYENAEQCEKKIPFGTFSKVYHYNNGADEKHDYEWLENVISLGRGAVLTRALGFGVGIGYETINNVKASTDYLNTENFDGLTAVRPKEDKKTSEKKSVKGVGMDVKSFDEFKSFVKPTATATPVAVENKPVADVTENHAVEVPTTVPETGNADFDKKLSSPVKPFDGLSVKELYKTKTITALDFFLKNNNHSDEDKSIVKAFLQTLNTKEAVDILERYA